MSPDSVEAILNSVRPLLQSEGGDIEVVGIDGNNAHVRLRGACTECPGARLLFEEIEKALRDAIPQFGELVFAPPVPLSLDDRLRQVETSLITHALTITNGNKSRAAALLKIKRSTLGDRIARCRLSVARARNPRRAGL